MVNKLLSVTTYQTACIIERLITGIRHRQRFWWNSVKWKTTTRYASYQARAASYIATTTTRMILHKLLSFFLVFHETMTILQCNLSTPTAKAQSEMFRHV